MDLDQHTLDRALQLLGKLLAHQKTEGFWLVVCGGSALLAQKIITRSTHDVDVLAMRDWDGGVNVAFPLPDVLTKAVLQVADELRLQKNWLNSAVSMHFPDLHLLSAPFWQELETRDYGPNLRISFVSRTGQIHLKFLAALNRAETRDFEDLRALKPDARETETVIRWVISSFPDLTHLNRLADLLTYLGHDHLIESFKR